jgi:hypothetical protein
MGQFVDGWPATVTFATAGWPGLCATQTPPKARALAENIHHLLRMNRELQGKFYQAQEGCQGLSIDAL